jgi:hypothetical protein
MPRAGLVDMPEVANGASFPENGLVIGGGGGGGGDPTMVLVASAINSRVSAGVSKHIQNTVRVAIISVCNK